MSMTRTLLTAALLLTPLLGQNVAVDRPSLPVVPPPEFDQVKQYLQLTDSQVTSLRELLQTRRKEEQAIHEQINQRYQQLNQLLDSGSNDAAAVGRLMVEINNLRRDLPVSGAPYRAPALAVLTDQQKQKLPQLAEALNIQQPAWQAVTLNLIDPPSPGDVRILPMPAAAEPLPATLNR